VRLNKPLLFGSLAISLVLSLAIGHVISGSGGEAETHSVDAVLTQSSTPDLVPTLNTNASVDNTPLVDFTVETLDGQQISTADLVGTPLVLNFWTSSCLPCKKELPDFAAIHAEYGDRVRIVGINSLGPADSEEQFARERGVAYELLYDTNGVFASEVGLATQPVTLFVAPDGTIVKQTGEIDAAGLRAAIEELLL
jgi:peroxiredoxin